MRHIILISIGLTLAASATISGTPALASTFERARIAPELGVDAFTRSVAREQLGRDVFSSPYSAVTLGSVDIYNVFPYVEARTFEVVSDPRWNRLVYGESGRSLKAFDGAGTTLGALSAPRGMAVDERNRIYVADAGNNRIVALDASTEFGEITLVAAFEIRGLSDPYDVAYSDGGTPFRTGDDVLYVADTGKNRVAAYALGAASATLTAAIGELGSGPGRFAGPMAITVGRSGGASTRDVYVADAHTQRIIRLRHEANRLSWAAETHVDADVVTSLDTDQWGNLYAAAPRAGVVRKYNASLAEVAELREGLTSPRGFHVPFVNVNDHRFGRTERVGRPNGLAVESWGDASGMKLWNLGLEVSGLAVSQTSSPEARFDLTDRAAVTLELVDAATGRTLARRSAGDLEAGNHVMVLNEAEAALAGGDRILRVTASSSYTDGPVVTAQTALSGTGAPIDASRARLLGHSPNPVSPMTRIAFVLPSGTSAATLSLFDASGREVRNFGSRFSPGVNQVVWDGTNDRGREAPAGVYFYQLEVGAERLTRKLVLVR